jgi:phosphogluconate dehydratase
MPELHSLTPLLSILQEQGHKVALVTDGRMSGASGKVPAAIHVCPEAVAGGAIAKIKDGDIITLDAVSGQLGVDADLDARPLPPMSKREPKERFGRPLFASLRGKAAPAEQGGGVNPLMNL